MGKVYTPTVITDINDLSAINQNFDDIEAALQDAVSRSGALPNHMTADLDLNNNNILNTANLPITPDKYVDTGTVQGTDLILTRTGGLANLQISLAAIVGTNCGFNGALVAAGSDINITTGITQLTFDTEIYDTAGFFAGPSDNKFTIPGGVSRIRLTAFTSFDDTGFAVGTRRLKVDRIGGSVQGSAQDSMIVPANFVRTLNPKSAIFDVIMGETYGATYTGANGDTLIAAGEGTWFQLEVLE